MKGLITMFLIFISSFIYSQSSYWQFEKKKSILSTAVDIEMLMELFGKNDHIEYDSKSGEAILYMYESNMKPAYLNDTNADKTVMFKFKIVDDKFKLLARSGIDDIYLMIFKKLDITESEFKKHIQELKE